MIMFLLLVLKIGSKSDKISRKKLSRLAPRQFFFVEVLSPSILGQNGKHDLARSCFILEMLPIFAWLAFPAGALMLFSKEIGEWSNSKQNNCKDIIWRINISYKPFYCPSWLNPVEPWSLRKPPFLRCGTSFPWDEMQEETRSKLILQMKWSQP